MPQPLPDTTDAELEALLERTDKPLRVEFHLPDCPYCARLEPLLEAAAERYAQRVTIVRMNAATNNSRPRHGLTATPTLVLYVDGEERLTKTGAMRERQLQSFLDAYV
jgi:thioredoxin-like negative regulator of GroEL